MPFELEAQLRIRPLKSDPLTAPELKNRAFFLKKALEAVQKSLELKSDYSLSKINKASILILQKKGQEAEKVVATLGKKHAEEARLLRGLLAMTQGKRTDAARLFESLKTSKNDRVRMWAKANQERLLSETPIIAACTFPVLPTVDGIFGYKKVKKTTNIAQNVQLGWEKYVHSTVFWASSNAKESIEAPTKMSIQIIHQPIEMGALNIETACLFGEYAIDSQLGLVFQLKKDQAIQWARILK